MENNRKLKLYDPREERLNVITHAAGALLAIPALALLLWRAQNALQMAAFTLYVLSLAGLFLGSTLYHAATEPQRRTFLRRIDHSAIYLLIAGTYTPMMLIPRFTVGTAAVLAGVWAIAVIGITLEIKEIKPFRGFSLLLYLLAGWLCVFVIVPLAHKLTPAGFAFLLAGGIIYSIGTLCYVSRRLYSHALWHVFVLAGAGLHYCAILTLPLS